MNLFEAGALLTPNTGSRNAQTVLDLSQQEKIAVLANRPLNARLTKNRGMLRLADPHTEPIESTFEIQRDELVILEDEFRKDLWKVATFRNDPIVVEYNPALSLAMLSSAMSLLIDHL